MSIHLFMHFIPIALTAEENRQFEQHPDCKETLYMTLEYYQRAGFAPPWISYFAMIGQQLVGSAGFKGAPSNGRVEISYGTFESHQRKGVGTQICRELVRIALAADPNVRITARTTEENEGSKGVLRNNGFKFREIVIDEEDGPVCEWEYIHLPE